MVRVSSWSDVLGRLKPTASISMVRPLATPMPRPTPIAEAATPSRTASSIRLRITWRRVAPIALSSAISRDLWVTIIVNVFQMMKEPTNRAIPAKIMNRMPTTLRSFSTASEFSCATVFPVTASAPSGTTALSRFVSSAWLTPSSALTPMLSKNPGIPRTAWAVSVSKYADVVPPRFFSPPKPTVPTTVNSWVGPWNSTLMVEPIAMSLSSALVASMATSPGASGALPERRSTSPRRPSSAGML